MKVAAELVSPPPAPVPPPTVEVSITLSVDEAMSLRRVIGPWSDHDFSRLVEQAKTTDGTKLQRADCHVLSRLHTEIYLAVGDADASLRADLKSPI